MLPAPPPVPPTLAPLSAADLVSTSDTAGHALRVAAVDAAAPEPANDVAFVRAEAAPTATPMSLRLAAYGVLAVLLWGACRRPRPDHAEWG